MPMGRLPINQKYGVPGLDSNRYISRQLAVNDVFSFIGVNKAATVNQGQLNIGQIGGANIYTQLKAIDAASASSFLSIWDNHKGYLSCRAELHLNCDTGIINVSNVWPFVLCGENGEQFLKVERNGANDYRLHIKQGNAWVPK